MITIQRTLAGTAPYAEHARDPNIYWREFCRRFGAEPGLNGKVLEIGCGSHLSWGIAPIANRMQSVDLDGVDPSPQVLSHPLLRRRWSEPFESADIPAGNYDLAYAWYVMEHISDGDAFFRKLRRVLKPGGVFWAITPHALHPFTLAVRTVQQLRLKQAFARRNATVNTYPALYRLNTARSVAKAAHRAGFNSAQFVYMPSMAWDQYFPSRLRVLPHAYDRMLGIHFRLATLVLAYRVS